MFKIKKLVITFLIFSLSLPIVGINIYAAQEQTSDEEISFNEYYSTMKEEYAKYGIKYEIIEKNDDLIITKGILQEQLELIKQQNTNLLNDNSLVYTPETINTTRNFIPNIIKPIMPITYTYGIPITVYSPSNMGYISVRVDANITENVDTGRFISLNSVVCYESGVKLNVKSWCVDSISKEFTSTCINITVYLTLEIEYTEKFTGLVVGYTSQHVLNCSYLPKY